MSDPEPIEINRDPSILQWLQRQWALLLAGNWRLIRLSPAPENEPPAEPVQVEDAPAGETPPADMPLPVAETPPSVHISNANLSFDIPVGTRVRITIDALPELEGGSSLEVQTDPESTLTPVKVTVLPLEKPVAGLPVPLAASRSPQPQPAPGAGAKVLARLQAIPLPAVLFVLSIGVYLATRLIGLDRFPIYFFTDEAIHTILAEDLVQNHYRFGGVLLPTYFSLGASFGLNSVSVYLQVLPYLLFGKSVFVTRAVSVLVTTLGAVAVGLILKDYFKSRYWWSGILVLSITPVWFMHSRTAFEYAELAAFYAIFLYFYLGYRLRSPRQLYLAIAAGALVFYIHGLGQFLIAASGILLLLVDLPYHWKNRKVVLLGLALILLLALPYYRFARTNAGMFEEQMRMRGSYWLDQNLNLTQKLAHFGSEYLTGLNPLYWFQPGPGRDLIRHHMKGYGNLSIFQLPFLLFGLWLAIKNIRSPAHRTVLVALVASPFGAALAQITILRVLWLVIPATLLTVLGLNAFLLWLEKKRFSFKSLSIGLFVVLLGLNVYMLQDALRNGPTWYTDYGLYGMQYGASQLFGEAIPEILAQDAQTRVVVTPTWANGTDNFVQFFLTPEQLARVKLDSIQAYLFEKLPVDENLMVVLTQPEYEQAIASNKFKDVEPQKVIYYPDGTPGFYFLHLAYSDQADAIFAAEKLERGKPVEGEVQIGDQRVKIRYSQIDMGQPEAMFDGDTHTLMRGLEANPLVIELEFPEPRPISQIAADFANMDFTLTARLFADPNGEAQVYETTVRGAQGDPHVELPIDQGPALVSKLRLEVLSLNGGERPHIHVRELKINP